MKVGHICTLCLFHCGRSLGLLYAGFSFHPPNQRGVQQTLNYAWDDTGRLRSYLGDINVIRYSKNF